ncbi:hypothetical protein WMY93_032992 [Mugilogobius chulae]|uniref:Ig-like domain-containing protein n=1 Tax=Mugilogobius chulae TaxID=88201 RepID=A0AAW0MI60_9GOBI
MESALCTLLSALVVLLCSSPECKGEDTVSQPAGDVLLTQGNTAKIECTFQTGDNTAYLYWYKQEGRGALGYMMQKTRSLSKWLDTVKSPELNDKRFEVEVQDNTFHLIIQDVDVTDSAVYYCALQPTVTGNTKTLNKNLWSKDNTILQLSSTHRREVELAQKTVEMTVDFSLSPYCTSPGRSQTYILRRDTFGTENNSPDFNKAKFDAELKETSFHLIIQDVDVTDSAVYYCALRPTVTGNTKTLNKNLWSKDNTILQ